MHINPKFGGNSQKVLVNPNFRSRTGESELKGTVHINPKFKPSPPVSPKTKTSGSTVHVNPKFSTRPLPPVPGSSTSKTPVKPQRTSVSKVAQKLTLPPEAEPIYSNIHLNPSFSTSVSIDQKRKIEFEQAIRSSVDAQSKVLVNPRFKKHVSVPETATSDKVKTRPEKPKRNSLYNPQMSTPVVSSTPLVSSTPACKTSNEEKENVPSSSVKSSKYNLFTPLRKTAFRKIGTKKLVRVKSKSPTAHTPFNTSFKKIGSKKLIRISKNTEKSTDKDSPARVYNVKTKTKIVKKTPTTATKSRFSFVTPMSLRRHKFIQRNSSTKLVLSAGKSVGTPTKKRSFRDRFRLDRRPKNILEPANKKKVISKKPSQSKLKSISGSLYHVSPTCLKKSAPSKPSRTTQTYRQKPTAIVPSLAANKFITVQGVRFAVADNGRKLKRLPDADDQSTAPATTPFTSPGSSQTSPSNPPSKPSPQPSASNFSRSASTRSTTHKRVYLGGEEFDEFQPGVFTRSRHSLTRQSLTQAKQRSINIILKSQNRSKQYCMFYNKFGKCTKRDKGSCPFIHDKDKIAVCRRFLKGACLNEACLLSHKVAPKKMPTCKFFLEGVCTADDCPYLHVKVNAKADICASFLKGYCKNGTDCKQRHVMACPEFDKTGLCRKGEKCPFPHVDRTEGKKKPPAKPKRKSLGMTPDHTLQKKSRVAQRYYQDNLNQDISDVKPDKEVKEVVQDTSNAITVNAKSEEPVKEDLEAKRKRLLKKIEVAKQGWSKAGDDDAEDENMKNMDESGPFENIDDDSSEDEVVTRAPIGQLGDFISIAGYSSEEEENCNDDRLI